MATSMGTSVSNTSAAIPFCNACQQIDNIVTESQYLCEICKHHLCNRCIEHHNRTLVTRDHKVIHISGMQYRESDFKVSGRLPNTISFTKSEASHKDASSDVSKDEGNLLLMENRTGHTYRKANLIRGLNVLLDNDSAVCVVAGIALLQEKIIVSDRASYKLKVFNSTYEYLFQHKCNKKPYDVDTFDDTTVAVTFLSGCLTLYTFADDGFKELINIETGDKCIGVCCFDGKLYCVVYCKIGSELFTEIRVYTSDGRLNQRLEYLSDGRTDFNHLHYITVNRNTGILYVTDWDKGVVALTTKGEVLTGMSPTKLKNPQGIAIDDHGQIYVCGCNSNNLLQISADGRETKEMVSSNQRSKLAQCVKVCGSKLFLARRESDVISIYELS